MTPAQERAAEGFVSVIRGGPVTPGDLACAAVILSAALDEAEMRERLVKSGFDLADATWATACILDLILGGRAAQNQGETS
jgi:hypothetical protein